jgi:hypothetical protein
LYSPKSSPLWNPRASSISRFPRGTSSDVMLDTASSARNRAIFGPNDASFFLQSSKALRASASLPDFSHALPRRNSRSADGESPVLMP